MALTENKIGPFPFISLRGEPIPPRMMCVIDDRPGVEGSEKVLVGTKGEPFSLISLVDSESYQSGKTFHAAYRTVIDDDAQELVQGGVSSETDGYRVLVLGVVPLRVYPITGAVGNKIHPPSQGMVETRWDLLAVPLED